MLKNKIIILVKLLYDRVIKISTFSGRSTTDFHNTRQQILKCSVPELLKALAHFFLNVQSVCFKVEQLQPCFC